MAASIDDLQTRGHQLKAALDAPAAGAAALRGDVGETAQALAALGRDSAAAVLGQSATARLTEVAQLLEQARAALDAFVQACEQAKGSGQAPRQTGGAVTGTATTSGPMSTPRARLTNAERAVVDDRKFTAYSMAPEHPKNREKWRAWADLGYDVHSHRREAADDVLIQLRAGLPDAEPYHRLETPHGQRVRADVDITGPNGRRGTLVSVWQYEPGSTEPKMVTHWLRVHTDNEGEQ